MTGTHPADAHDLIRVEGAREHNLKDVSLVLPKRRLTVFTGVSGSGKSSLVFATIAVVSAGAVITVRNPVHAALAINEVLQSAGHLLTPYSTHFRLSHGLRHQARELLVGCYRFARGLGHRGQKRFLHNPETPRSLDMFRLWIEASAGDPALIEIWEKTLHTRHETADQPASQPSRRTHRRPRRRRQSKPA